MAHKSIYCSWKLIKSEILINTYNTNMITIVKPIPYLYTTAKNKPLIPKSLRTSRMNKGRKRKNAKPHRVPPISCLASLCSTSISVTAASRYLCMERIILIATTSFFSLSKHSKTCPKVPTWKKSQDYCKNDWNNYSFIEHNLMQKPLTNMLSMIQMSKQ